MEQIKTLTEADLMQFIGTENYWRHWLGFNYTDGVKYLAEKGEAYWQLSAKSKKYPFSTVDFEDKRG